MTNKTRKNYKKDGGKPPMLGLNLNIEEINKDIQEFEREINKRNTPEEIIQKRISEQIKGIQTRNERIRTGVNRSKNPFRVGKKTPPRKTKKSPASKKSQSRLLYSHSMDSKGSERSKGSKTKSVTRIH